MPTTGSTRALSRSQARVLDRALCRLRLDCRACAVQRLPARLVTTPQTVHSFTRESSMGVAGVVYSPRVLRLADHKTIDTGRAIPSCKGPRWCRKPNLTSQEGAGLHL